ncbi:unnamed protein product, partial [Didymodactylos carnosus]
CPVTSIAADQQQESLSSVDQPVELRTPDILDKNNPFSASQPSTILDLNEYRTGNSELEADSVCWNDYINDIPDDVYEDDTNSLIDLIDESFSSLPSSAVSSLTTELSNALALESREWITEDPETKKRRRPLLFEFLHMLLDKPQYREYVSYVNTKQGIFKLHKPNEIAALWKDVKGRNTIHDMTYEKLARALRFYYKTGVIVQTPGRHTFQFGPKSGFGSLWTPKE